MSSRARRQRTAWVTAAALLALVALLAATWGLHQQRAARRAWNRLEAGYQRSFFALVEHVENLETLLAKTLASGSPMHQAVILTRVQAEAQAAQEALAGLPIGLELQRSHQLLAQTGDYAYVLAEHLAAGQAPAETAWTTLAELKSQAAELMADLARIRSESLDGRFRWTDVAPAPAVTDPSAQANPPDRPAAAAGGPSPGTVTERLQELDRALQEVPALIYDGPFSEQNLRPEPRSDLGAEVRAGEAAERAAAFLTGRGSGRWRAVVDPDPIDGPIPAWVVTLERERQGTGGGPAAGVNRVVAHVSRAGGHVLWFLGEMRQTGTVMPGGAAAPGDGSGDGDGDGAGDSRAQVEAFLRERGLEDFVTTGWVRRGDQVTYSLVRERDGIRYYPELIKVTLDPRGAVVGYDAVAYWLNRDPARRLPVPALSAADARSLAGPLLEILGVRQAVIPLPSGRHVLAFEVAGALEDDRFLIYYNAVTGREEVILRLVETEWARITF